MYRIRTTVSTAALVALTTIGILFGTAGTASASADSGVCRDGGNLVVYYVNIGDQATASALMDTLVAMGC
jgi:hypothetical protein